MAEGDGPCVSNDVVSDPVVALDACVTGVALGSSVETTSRLAPNSAYVGSRAESLVRCALLCFDFVWPTKYCSGSCGDGNGREQAVFWRRKPAYVEWDPVRDETRGFGADIFLSAAPMVIVHQIDPDYRTYDDISSAVEEWVASVPDKYRLNEAFEEFKAIARQFGDGDASKKD